MRTGLALVQCLLRKNAYILASFFLPLVIRSIPEILSWPYPLGLDTLKVIPQIQQGWIFSSGLVGFLGNTSLFFLLAGSLYELSHNVFTTIKILGPLLLAGLSFMMYLYARKGLGWSSKESLIVSILVAAYFVSLRNSWDLLRQTLGLIFLMAALVSLKSFSSPRRYYAASIFMVLTVFSHELVSVILFFMIVLEASRLIVKRLRKDSVYLLASAVFPAALFLFQLFSLQEGTLVVPANTTAAGPSINLALYMGGLLIYCYAIILPLVFLGQKVLRDRILKYWILLCAGIPLLEMLYPNAPLYFWNRWVYLLVYPLLFFAVQGIKRLWRYSSDAISKVKRSIPKVFAIAYLSLLFVLSGYYLTTSPENAFPYFSQYNPYLAYIPSSMLQNTVSLSDNPSLVDCFEWVTKNTAETSVLVTHYALYDQAVIYVHNRLTVPVLQNPSMWTHVQNEATLADEMVEAAGESSASGHKVYTVWWISGEGWYGIRSVPSSFKEVYHSGKMAVFLYDPNS